MVLQFLKVIQSVGFRLLRCNYNAAYCQVQQLHKTLWHHHSQLYIYAIKIKIKMYTLQHCGTGCSQYTVKLHTSSLCTQITHYHSRHIYMHKLFITFHAVSLMENFCCCSCVIKKNCNFLSSSNESYWQATIFSQLPNVTEYKEPSSDFKQILILVVDFFCCRRRKIIVISWYYRLYLSHTLPI